MDTQKKDFFISYTGKDVQWATWIAGTLEKAGITTIIQAWDFVPGGNFVGNMDDALLNCNNFIAVLSKAYLQSDYCKDEWTAAFTKKQARFIPVRIEKFNPEGLWAPKVYINLCDKDEQQAETVLLEGVSSNLPSRERPNYPGSKKGNAVPTPYPGLPPNNLPRRNTLFTGREEKLEQIHQTFETGDDAIALTQTITGLGGIGKTQIALEYAFRYAKNYESIWWINAENKETIIQDYTRFAHLKNIVPIDIYDSVIIIDKVRLWMSQHDSWLFIFDNAEDEAILETYAPAQCRGKQHILITSRYTNWTLEVTKIDIEVFTLEEAINFLNTHTQSPPDEPNQTKLAEELGYLPLALEQAAAYIKRPGNNTTYATYLNLYSEHKTELLKDKPNQKLPTAVYFTWQISIIKIESEAARQLLTLCAFFAPDKINAQWFTDASECLPTPLKETVQNSYTYNKVKTELTIYSLVKIGNNKISIHRLLQHVIKDSLQNDKTMCLNSCIQILNKLIYSNFSTAESRTSFNELIPHIIALTEQIPEEKQKEKTANLYYFLGNGFYELANYSQAFKWYEKALAIREKVLGKEHPSTATTYNNIALVYDNQGDYEKALEWYEKALVIREKVLGKEHPSTATSYNNIALVYNNQGDYEKALEWYEKDLAICEKVLGKEHPDTATTYNNIALVYNNQGDYEKALEWYEKALAICEKVLGKEHPDTATTYNNIALVYDNQGDYEKALEWYEKALVIREKVLGKEHPSTATSYNNIAAVYNNQGDYEKALEWHEKALVIREKVLGKEHPDTVTIYNNIAAVYDSLGDHVKAQEWREKANGAIR